MKREKAKERRSNIYSYQNISREKKRVILSTKQTQTLESAWYRPRGKRDLLANILSNESFIDGHKKVDKKR
jgi:hypothetical protein